ncbi:hypothetical protein SK128_001019 [Halocaridina rubra]|uniref:SCP domain-containing protein n=1 Tax=Halocaridina rubra TaxID=373956 RepID=A0AAN8WI59_HALRR
MLRWCFLIIPFQKSHLVVSCQVLCNPWEPLYFHIKQDFTKLFEKEPTVEISRESEMLPYDLGPLTYPDLTGVCNKGCDDYKVFTEDDPSQTHSACYEEYKCYIERSGVSNEEAKYITDMHNFIRAKVARGEENFGTIEGQYLPAAADMHKMVWNWELAKVAEYWARTCAGRDERYHDCNDCRHVFSSNLMLASHIAKIPDPTLKTV